MKERRGERRGGSKREKTRSNGKSSFCRSKNDEIEKGYIIHSAIGGFDFVGGHVFAEKDNVGLQDALVATLALGKVEVLVRLREGLAGDLDVAIGP